MEMEREDGRSGKPKMMTLDDLGGRTHVEETDASLKAKSFDELMADAEEAKKVLEKEWNDNKIDGQGPASSLLSQEKRGMLLDNEAKILTAAKTRIGKDLEAASRNLWAEKRQFEKDKDGLLWSSRIQGREEGRKEGRGAMEKKMALLLQTSESEAEAFGKKAFRWEIWAIIMLFANFVGLLVVSLEYKTVPLYLLDVFSGGAAIVLVCLAPSQESKEGGQKDAKKD
jgi:hypothetical protein